MFRALNLPPGLMANGTDYAAVNRWRTSSLVRWFENTIRPVGGWRQRAEVTTQPPRGAVAWQDNDNKRWLALGAADELFVVDGNNVVTDITPVDLAAGRVHADYNIGYGGGLYGDDTYGTERPGVGEFSEATTWSLDTFGQYLVACATTDGRLFWWDLNVANDAVPISGAPTDCLGLVVTPERFLFALGANLDPKNVAWADRESMTVWTPTPLNQAGSFRLQTTGQIMCGLAIRGQTLILTDVDAHVANYVGPPFVYGFERVGSACGVISRRAAASVDAGTLWMGQQAFYSYAGGAAQPLPSEVSEAVFSDMNRAQASKVYAVSNTEFGEVWWFYPSEDSLECNRYVTYNYRENHWALGEIERTAGVDRGVFRNPIFASPAGVAYDHEVGYDRGSAVPFAETGPVQFDDGNTISTIRRVLPDERQQGDVSISIASKFYPNGERRDYGPFTLRDPVGVRVSGRSFRIRLTEANYADWRFGRFMFDMAPRGAR